MKFDIDAPPAALVSTQLREAPGAQLKNPERLAWLVIWGAFTVCVLLTITLPLGARQFVLYAVDPRPGRIEAISPTQRCSTVNLTLPNATQPSAVTCDNPTTFPEGSVLATDSTSRAFVTFFDGSTAQIAPSSRVTIQAMHQPRFSWSQLPNTIELQLEQGSMRYGVAPAVVKPGNPDGRPVSLLVHTPNFVVSLTEGSYTVDANTDSSQVVAWEGTAVVRSLDGAREVTIGQGQRLQVFKGQPLPEPVAAAQNLILDGNFASDLKCSSNADTAWKCFFDQGGDGGNVDGTVQVVTTDNRRALQIRRTGANNNSAVTGVRQMLNRDVWDFRSITLYANIKLHYQNLSGGGYQSSEYPLILKLKYRDVNGNEFDIVRGFYYQNTDENPTRNGQSIPQDQWVPITVSNLWQELGYPKPFQLLYIELYASGWDYESYVSGVRLTVE